jgi:uncharacterized SAM-binding protein YcdF (DUF218 family)
MFVLRSLSRFPGRIPGLGFLNPWSWMRRIAILVVAVYLALSYAEVWTAARRDESGGARSFDAIVVLGAAQYNGKPSPVLRGRLDHALSLYKQKRAKLIVVTGGRQPGDRATEATASANYLLERGVPDQRIIREVKGRNTYQSLAAAARVLRARSMSQVLLVTDGFHAARVAAIAEEVGLKPSTSPVDSAAPAARMLKETAAVAVGRVLGFRRLSAWFDR